MEQRHGGGVSKGKRVGREAVFRGGRKPWITLMLCLLVMGVIYLLRVIEGIAEIGVAQAGSAVAPYVSVMLLGVVSLTTVALIVRMLVDAYLSSSPFSYVQSKRMIVLGFLLFACALFEEFTAAGFAYSTHLADIVTILGTSTRFGAPNIEILLIAAAFVSFYLSYIFKYGSFLQCFYDETF